MKHSSAKQKISQHNKTAETSPSAGPDGISVTSPTYGIESVDRASAETIPVPEQQPIAGTPTQRKADLSAAGSDDGSGPTLGRNRTGLPDALKAGVESLSGLALDDVRVHYNSPRPSALQALAYTQGTDIHVAPGQERHLPHEAWHVVQQAQGRVKPTMQLKGGVQVNHDAGLEHEADVMGMNALGFGGDVAQRKVHPAEYQTHVFAAPSFTWNAPIQMVNCSGDYLAGLFNQNNVTALRQRIGEPAYQHFLTLDTANFSPMIDAFLPQTPILNAAAQVAYLLPYIGNPVQLDLAIKALRYANYVAAAAPPYYNYLLQYQNLGIPQLASAEQILTAEANNIGVAHYIYKYTHVSPRVLGIARIKLGLAGNDPLVAEQTMLGILPYNYYDSVKGGADVMAAAIAGAEIAQERLTAQQQNQNFLQNYQAVIGTPITTAFTAHTAHQREAQFLQVFPGADLGTGNAGSKRNIMNQIRADKILELNGRDANILAQLPARTTLKATNIQQRLAPLYVFPDGEAAANWCIAQAGQDTALLTTCVEIMVAVAGRATLRDRFDPLSIPQKHALLSNLSDTLNGQLDANHIGALLELLAPLNITQMRSLINLLLPTLDSRGISDLVLNLDPANGTAIDAFVRQYVPTITGGQLGVLVQRLQPLTLAQIDTYINLLLTGINLGQIHALTVALNPAAAQIGVEILHLADMLITTIPNPLSVAQFRTLVLAMDGLPGNQIDAMVTQLIGLGMNDGANINTRITTMRGNLTVGGNAGTDVTTLNGERIRSGPQIATHIGQVHAAAGGLGDMLMYPKSGINPVGRLENLLWGDCDSLVVRHPTETVPDIVMRQQMALNAIIALPGVDRQIAQRVFAEKDGREPRDLKTAAEEDAISGGHIDDRHVLGTGGTINTTQQLQARADGAVDGMGNLLYPPCPGVAGAFANAGASQAGMQAALTAHRNANPNNWHLLRQQLIRAQTVNLWNIPAAVAGHVARNGLPMNNAPGTVHIQFTGADVEGGFHVFESWPTL